MKIDLCSYSGYKIYPGHGKKMVKVDGRMFQFLNKKCESLHLRKVNPRKINWTVLYRRKHKKGMAKEVSKKRTRKTTKYQRSIAGTTLTDILAKRNQKPEVRKALREQAERALREKRKANQALKKPVKSAPPKVKHGKSSQPKIKKPQVGGKR